MPEHRNCISCGRRVFHIASSALHGTICRECRTRLCRQCGQPFHGRHWSAFCSTACNRGYWQVFYEKRAS